MVKLGKVQKKARKLKPEGNTNIVSLTPLKEDDIVPTSQGNRNRKTKKSRQLSVQSSSQSPLEDAEFSEDDLKQVDTSQLEVAQNPQPRKKKKKLSMEENLKQVDTSQLEDAQNPEPRKKKKKLSMEENLKQVDTSQLEDAQNPEPRKKKKKLSMEENLKQVDTSQLEDAQNPEPPKKKKKLSMEENLKQVDTSQLEDAQNPEPHKKKKKLSMEENLKQVDTSQLEDAQNIQSRKKKKKLSMEENLEDIPTESQIQVDGRKISGGKLSVDSESDLSADESINSEASFNIDSYPSDDEEEALSGNESDNSESSFNIDSYPSDDEDEEDEEEANKKRGIPFNSVPSDELEERENRTVFVGNLPKSVLRNELHKWFGRFGKVECVRLRSAPIADLEMPRKVAVIKKSFHDNRSNIHAYIRFVNVEGARNALQANGVKYGNHTIRVDQAKHQGGYDAKKAIFVGNVPFAIEENSLMYFFSKCGEIEGVRIIRDRATGVGKGFAYVNFKCSSSIPLALKLDGEILEKRQLRVCPVKYNQKKKQNRMLPYNQTNPGFTSGKFASKKGRGKEQFMNNKKTGSFRNAAPNGNTHTGQVSKSKVHQPFRPASKKNKFQGELSKRKDKKQFKRKSFVEKKREKISKILQKKDKQ